MASSVRSVAGRFPALLALHIAVLALAGCGGGSEVGKVYPVQGTVTCDGAPMTKGSVRFVPMKDKGNTTKFEPVGVIGDDGSYKLLTLTDAGAPAGWYQVAVASGDIPDSTNPKAAKSPIAARFANPDASKLTVEVVPAPAVGAYDLKVSSK